MKFIRAQNRAGVPSTFIFLTNKREKALLLATLKLYPLLDAGFHQITRGAKPVSEGGQQWLTETMEQQRLEHKKKLDQFFENEARFFKDSKGEMHFALMSEQMEWLLRVLNEIRVGSWVQLGRPDMDAARKISPLGQKARSFAAMELSGYFQCALLEAF